MLNRDLHNNVKVSPAIDPAAVRTGNGVTVGNTIDTQGYDSLEFVIQSGVITDGSLTPALFQGNQPNMSDEVQVVDGSLDQLGSVAGATFAATDDSVTKKIGYRGGMRYCRLKITQAGATTGGFFSAVAVQGNPLNSPAGAPIL